MKRVIAVILSVVLMAMCLAFTASAESTYNFEDISKKVNWTWGGATEDSGFDGDVLRLKSTSSGGFVACYMDDYRMGDGTIRFKLKINRNPNWVALMFRVSGGKMPLEEGVAYYHDGYDKYSVFIDGDGAVMHSTWKKGSGREIRWGEYDENIATTTPFDDGEFHLVEIESKKTSNTVIQNKLYIDGKPFWTAVDDGDEDLCNGPAITSDGYFGIHAWQAANSPLGPDIEIAPAGAAVSHNDTPATTPSKQSTPSNNTSSAKPNPGTTTSAATPTESTVSEATNSEEVTDTSSEEVNSADETPDATVSDTASETEDTSSQKEAEANTKNDGKTGGNWWIWVIIAAAVIIIAVIVIVLVTKKKGTPTSAE